MTTAASNVRGRASGRSPASRRSLPLGVPFLDVEIEAGQPVVEPPAARAERLRRELRQLVEHQPNGSAAAPPVIDAEQGPNYD